MPLTKEQLLIPRYKVIADYPGNGLEVGTIMTPAPDWKDFTIKFWSESYSKFPHLFKLLPWWCDRNAEDMPDYLRINYGNGPVLCKVNQWMHKIGEQMVFEYYKNGLPLRETTQGTEPITEEEYNEYINQKQ